MDNERTSSTEKDLNESRKRTKLGWNARHDRYACLDGRTFGVPCRTANVRDLDETKTVHRSAIRYTADNREVRITASGIEYNRNMIKVFGGSDDIRTTIFSEGVRTIRQGAFHGS